MHESRTTPSAGATRRDVLRASAGLAAIGAWLPLGCRASEPAPEEPPAPAPPRRMLVLGGTVFLGPEIVNAAREAGWEVTLFNRGRSNPGAFPGLDERIGDRNTDDYASLAEGTWDLVVDTSGYIPAHVTAAIEALGGAEGGRIGHYVFVSTVSVYADGDAEGDAAATLDEEGELARLPEGSLDRYRTMQDVDGAGYGALKALCEEAAQAALPDRVTIVRPGLIVGPEDRSDRYTYWPVRIAEGGDVLAPGDPDAHVQFIDVRDLGPFCFAVGAARAGETYNAVGFDTRVTMRDVLESCVLEDVPTTLRWASDGFLLENDVAPWMGLPLWIPGGGGSTYANERALARGLTCRPLVDTARATLAWAREEIGPDHRWRAGITREKEQELLAALDS